MSDDGDMKDDVKKPEGELGAKIQGFFDAEKDTSAYKHSEDVNIRY